MPYLKLEDVASVHCDGRVGRVGLDDEPGVYDCKFTDKWEYDSRKKEDITTIGTANNVKGFWFDDVSNDRFEPSSIDSYFNEMQDCVVESKYDDGSNHIKCGGILPA